MDEEVLRDEHCAEAAVEGRGADGQLCHRGCRCRFAAGGLVVVVAFGCHGCAGVRFVGRGPWFLAEFVGGGGGGGGEVFIEGGGFTGGLSLVD